MVYCQYDYSQWIENVIVKVQINCGVTNETDTPANQSSKCHGSKVCNHYVTNNIHAFTYVNQHFRLLLLIKVL